ncbi:PEP-CTERM sorting domain-containing protein [Rubripirellula reticaptiva]|uniref:Uncharacterized protein n=1 Tax=Rubripirellula reticaptiva TaxID=2528013 RepID=A0A5C6EU06_9BACT|nr:PEP-CTERM sorting domain-containing protein [Rubripirellula reticaptiva]TWU51874.1 hypothetical protein Poly59_34690 [Rubripirellula reticaptiva]
MNRVLILIILVCSSAGVSRGAMVLTFDVNANLPDNQANLNLAANASFDVAINIALEAGDSLSAYAFKIRFDSEELILNSIVRTTPNVQFFTIDSSATNRNGNDDARLGNTNYQEVGVSAITNPVFIGGNPISGPFNFRAALLTFQSTGSLVSGDTDLIFELAAGDGFTDANGLSAVPNLSSSGNINATAVPEPSSLATFGLFCCVALGRRRRRSSGQKMS